MSIVGQERLTNRGEHDQAGRGGLYLAWSGLVQNSGVSERFEEMVSDEGLEQGGHSCTDAASELSGMWVVSLSGGFLLILRYTFGATWSPILQIVCILGWIALLFAATVKIISRLRAPRTVLTSSSPPNCLLRRKTCRAQMHTLVLFILMLALIYLAPRGSGILPLATVGAAASLAACLLLGMLAAHSRKHPGALKTREHREGPQ